MPLINQFAIQLYSVRDIIGSDFKGTLKKLAGFGYSGVEFAGYGGLSAEEMKQTLDSCNLKSIGSHIGFEGLTKRLDEEIAYNKVLGTEYLVCPRADIKTKEDVPEIVKTLTPVIKKIQDAGLKFAYHNHAHEFVKAGEEYLLDILFQNLPLEAKMELDIFWSSYAGVEPFAYMAKYKDRLKLLHVKQIDGDKHCVDLDQGILNFREIISRAKTLGTDHFILEQEEFKVSSMVSAKNGIDYIMSLEE
jgi:sugar phosphate isomerase/epimerase